MSNLILEVEVRCHKVQGVMEAFADTPCKNEQFSSPKSRIHDKSFRHDLHLVTAHLHLQNQVAHTVRTRDFWLAILSIHFPIHISNGARTSIP